MYTDCKNEPEPMLTVSTTSLIFSASGEQQIFTITSNDNWTVESDAPWWLTIFPILSSNNGTVSITAAANMFAAKRTAMITVTGSGGITQTIEVIQLGATPTLTVSHTSMGFAYGGNQEGGLLIISNTDWSISCSAAWLDIVPLGGSYDSWILIRPEYINFSTSLRTAIVTVTTESGIRQTITVTQAGAPPNLTVSTYVMDFTSDGEQQSFTITSNTCWTALSNESSASWLTVSPSSGSDNSTITVTVAANTSVTPRTATITILGGGLTEIISITQAGLGN
jgi:hypothetical protein